jgi:hypothetical protein
MPVLMPTSSPAAVDQGAAGVAGLDRGVGLDESSYSQTHVRAAGGADDAGGDRLAQLKRAADRQHPFADLELARIAPRDDRQAGRGIFSSAMSVVGSVPITLPLISRLSGSAIVISRTLLADDVVVGDDVAVGGDDDAGAEAHRPAIARAELLVVAEEVAEERIVGERRIARADDLQRRDVGHALDGHAGDAREVRPPPKRAGAAGRSVRRGAALAGSRPREFVGARESGRVRMRPVTPGRRRSGDDDTKGKVKRESWP